MYLTSYKSAESYFVEPLAWAIVFGLSFATIATLFVTPALLALPNSLNVLFSKFKNYRGIPNIKSNLVN